MTVPSLRDLALAFRRWGRSPGLTISAALTIALGMGATTTVFSAVESLFLRSVPGIREPDRLVTVQLEDRATGASRLFSYPEFQDFSRSDNALQGIAAADLLPASVGVNGGGEPELVLGMAVSPSYFSVLGTRAALGRLLLPGEDVRGAPDRVVVLSHRYWQRTMGADSSVIGRSILINQASFTVVGVAEEGFQGHMTAYDFALWVPLSSAQAMAPAHFSRGYHNLSTVGRLATGTTLERARMASARIADAMRIEQPGELDNLTFDVQKYTSLLDEVRGPTTLYLGLMMALAGLLLALASLNVGGMLLVSAASRRAEMGVRLALGASRGALVRQLLLESAVLFLLGGGGGVLLAYWATGALNAVTLPAPVPIALALQVDPWVLTFAAGFSLVTGVAFGLAPALHATRIEASASLVREGSGLGGRSCLRNSFIVAQVAGSVVLLAVSANLLGALRRAGDVDLGFEPDNVQVLSLDLSVTGYSKDEAAVFLSALEDGAAALPGVEKAALAQLLPLGSISMRTVVEVPGRAPVPAADRTMANLNFVSRGFFSTLGISPLEGRDFSATDAESDDEIVVNRAAADLLWPGEDPLGKSLRVADRDRRIVGVVANTKLRSLGERPQALVYLPFAERATDDAILVVKSGSGGPPIGTQLRELLYRLDPRVPLKSDRPFSQVIGFSLLPQRIGAWVAGSFGVFGLLLTAIGVFGVLAHAVTARRREIGVRMALGAGVQSIRKGVLRDGMVLVSVGLALGIPTALLVSWSLRGMLFGLSFADPLTYGVIVALVALVGIIGGYVPARRATRFDPQSALAAE